MRQFGLALPCLLLLNVAVRADDLPSAVKFAGPDGITLVGYLFRPERAKPHAPAIVMMHGRGGPYSTLADGTYDAGALSKRHLMWGRLWAGEGYLAILVDSFGPRGYAKGFPIHSYKDRPDAVNEVTVRPRDAYAALAFLRARDDVDPARVALMGWSNGGSATLSSLADSTLATTGLKTGDGFRGGIALYPACGLKGRFDAGYRPYAPVRVFSGDADEEVSTERCRALVDASREQGSDIALDVYPGATHGFDTPGRKRQSNPANVAATEDTVRRALAFMRNVLVR